MTCALGRLFAHAIAHRGLHDRASGVIENSADAVHRAVEAGYGFEVDVQVTADGEAVVFHDHTLDRLTPEKGRVADRTAADLCQIPLLDSANGDRIWRLADLLTLVAGRAPFVIEMKSAPNSDSKALVRRTAELLSASKGPCAAKSFDPRMVAEFRRAAPGVPRGVVACAFSGDDPDWQTMSAARRFAARNLLHWPMTRPHFISFGVRDLPSPAVSFFRKVADVPVMTWTVRTPQDQARAVLYADQMIFEGFIP